MPRAVGVRDPDDWTDEMMRLRRLSRAADIDPHRSSEWKAQVRRHADALLLLIGASSDGERAAIEMAQHMGGGR